MTIKKPMKIKIICRMTNRDVLEENVNKFLKENHAIEVKGISSATTAQGDCIVILYEEK